MSEKYSPKSFDEGDSDYRQFKDMEYRDELLAGAEKGSQRYEEAKEYDERLKAMEGRSEEDVYGETLQQSDAVDRAIAAGDPQVRFMKALAEQIAVLRNKKIDDDRSDRDIQALQDKEDSFNERLAEYENREDADSSVIDRLMELATEEREVTSTSNEENSGDDENKEKTAADYKNDFDALSDDEKQALLDAAYGTDENKSFSVADFVAGAADAPESYKFAFEAARKNGFEPKSNENATTSQEADIKDYKDLNDEEKAEVIHAVEGTIRGIDQSYGSAEGDVYNQRINELRDGLIRDGGMTEDEAEQVIKTAIDNLEEGHSSADSSEEQPTEDDEQNHENMSAEDQEYLKLWERASIEEKEKIFRLINGDKIFVDGQGEAVEGNKHIDSLKEEGKLEDYLNAIGGNEAAILMRRAKQEGGYLEPNLPDFIRDEDGLPIRTEVEEPDEELDEEPRKSWLDKLKNMSKKAKIITGLGAAAAATTVVAFLVLKNGGDHSTVLDTAQNLKDAIGARGSMGETLSSNWNIPNGGGLLEAMRTHGIDTTKLTGNVAQHLIDSFPKEFEWHGNDIWISKPGELSNQASAYLESLK